jgi:hypothetical protein
MKKELEMEIQRVRELLHKKIEENSNRKEIQETSEELDIFIVKYLKNY